MYVGVKYRSVCNVVCRVMRVGVRERESWFHYTRPDDGWIQTERGFACLDWMVVYKSGAVI